VAVVGTDYVLTGVLPPPSTWVAAIALGALSAAALNVNNVRDAAHDADVGRRTFAVVFGAALARRFYALGLALPFALLLALGFHLEYPKMTRFNFSGGIEVMHSFTALLIALVLYTAAFIAEIVRAGIQAISRGQTEAAFALGLRPGRTMSLIILPQALRVIIPPLISQYLNLTKNTSLAIAVSYMDLRGTLGGVTLNQTGKELECMLLMMLIYLTISLMISSVMNIYNSSVKLKER
jgi:ABC-type amino acid transport system permease subunit